MSKTIDLQKAIETKSDLQDELTFLENAKAPKSMLDKKRVAISELDTLLSENESAVKCTELISALEPIKAEIVNAVVNTKSDFPLNIRFRFEGMVLSKFTVTAAVASGSGSGTRTTGTLTYDGTALPKNVSCNYKSKKDFAVTGKLVKGTVYRSYKDAAMAVLSCIPELKKMYDAGMDNKKYHSASAHDVLYRMISVDIDQLFARSGVVNGPATDEK